MKILGENSLSSKVIIGLKILFTAISAADIFALSLIFKSIASIIMKEDIQNNIFNLVLFVMIIITGIIALFIIHQFTKIFKNLKNNVLFCKDNSDRLNNISRSCFAIGTIYFIIAIFVLLVAKNSIGEITYYIFAFSALLMFIFIVLGIGIKVLNEIYKKAIKYKEENDFTI